MSILLMLKATFKKLSKTVKFILGVVIGYVLYSMFFNERFTNDTTTDATATDATTTSTANTVSDANTGTVTTAPNTDSEGSMEDYLKTQGYPSETTASKIFGFMGLKTKEALMMDREKRAFDDKLNKYKVKYPDVSKNSTLFELAKADAFNLYE